MNKKLFLKSICVLLVMMHNLVRAQDYENKLFLIEDEANNREYYVDINGTRVGKYWTGGDCSDPFNDWAKWDLYLTSEKKEAGGYALGLMDFLGNEVVPCVYRELYLASSNSIVVVGDSEVIIMDMEGRAKKVLPHRKCDGPYSSPYTKFINECSVIICEQDNGVSVAYRIDGTPLFSYTSINYNNNVNLFEVWDEEKGAYGYVDVNGKIVIPLKYSDPHTTSNCEFFKGGKCLLTNKNSGVLQLLDSKGKVIELDNYTSPIFSDMHEGLFRVQNKATGKYGFIDDKGKEVIPCTFDWADDFYGGLALVQIDRSHYGYIDKKGKMFFKRDGDVKDDVYHYRFNSLGYAPFRSEINGKYGIIDKTGRIVWDASFDRISCSMDNSFLVRKNEKYGLIDINGNWLVKCVYEYYEPTDGGYFWINGRGEFTMFTDARGNITDYSPYDGIQPFRKNYSLLERYYDRDGEGRALYEYGYYDMLLKKEVVPCQYDHETASLKLVDYLRDQIRPDVDVSVPYNKTIDNQSTYAFIVANEDYPSKNVPYALNDGRVFKDYCQKTLGVPSNHIRMLENATVGQMISFVEQMKQAARANSGKANIIFYYAGHAFPDEATKTTYLLPVDGDSKLTATGYGLDRLYRELSGEPCESVLCFIDACFSGATREDEVLLEGRGVAIKVKEEVPQGNVVVFTSATGAETAHQYKAQKHGMFTYFLLKKLQESQGNVTLGELSDYVIENVMRTSYDVNNKIQTPTVIPSIGMQNKWRSIKF